MRPQIKNKTAIVAISTDIERTICHAGGSCTAIRSNISTGAQKGNIDTATDMNESAEVATGKIKADAAISGSKITKFHCCASSTELNAAPTPAKIDAYRRNPRM